MVISGFGALRTVEGFHYIGEFVAGQPNGFGRALYATKAYYMGHFKEGKPHGFGNWTNGVLRFEGEFVEGIREGRGRLSSYTTGKTIYEGLFHADQPVKAGWQRKPAKIALDPNTNTMQSLSTTSAPEDDFASEEVDEGEVISLPLHSVGFN